MTHTKSFKLKDNKIIPHFKETYCTAESELRAQQFISRLLKWIMIGYEGLTLRAFSRYILYLSSMAFMSSSFFLRAALSSSSFRAERERDALRHTLDHYALRSWSEKHLTKQPKLRNKNNKDKQHTGPFVICPHPSYMVRVNLCRNGVQP